MHDEAWRDEKPSTNNYYSTVLEVSLHIFAKQLKAAAPEVNTA
jgi:hypothetical protein